MDLKQQLYGERYPIDEDFLAALEDRDGLPDCGGIALGFDRLVMLATGADHIETCCGRRSSERWSHAERFGRAPGDATGPRGRSRRSEFSMILHPDCEAYLEAGSAGGRDEHPVLGRYRPAPGQGDVQRADAVAEPSCRRWTSSRITRSRAAPGPPAAHPAAEGGGDRPLPVALYFHGGGYVLGGIEESEDEARRIAANTPALVISASYRLGPDHPFPAAIDDAYDALLWAAHHAASSAATRAG